MPQLSVGESVAECGHPGRVDSILNDPVRLRWWIVCDSLPLQQERREREHALLELGFWASHRAMAHEAVVAVDLGPGNEVGFVGRNRNAFGCFFRHSRMHRHAFQRFLEWQCSRAGGNRGHAEKDGGQQNERQYAKTDQQSQKESSHFLSLWQRGAV